MIEEEVNQLRKENAELKEAAIQRDRRIEELEGLLMGALLRIEELERRLAKNSHNSSKPRWPLWRRSLRSLLFPLPGNWVPEKFRFPLF